MRNYVLLSKPHNFKVSDKGVLLTIVSLHVVKKLNEDTLNE